MASRLAHRFVVASALLWASAGVAAVLAPAATPASAMAAARLLIGGVALALGAGPRGLSRMTAALPRRHLGVAVAAMALYQWSFFAAVAGAGVTATAFVSAAAAPFFADAFAFAFPTARARAFPAPLWVLAASFCAAGTLAFGFSHPAALAGLALALASGAAYAIYTVAAARLGASGQAGSAVALIGAGLALLPVCAGRLDCLFSLRALLVAAWLGLACTALAYRLFAAGLRCLAPGRALALLFVEPVAAALLGALLLDERLTAIDGLGIALLALAALLHRGAPPSDSPQPPTSKGKQPCPHPAAHSSSSTSRTNTFPETC